MLGDLLWYVGLAEDLPDDAVDARIGLGDACGQRLHGARTPLLPRFHSTTNEAQFVVRMSASEIRVARVSPERVLKGVHACGRHFCFVVMSFAEGTLRGSCPESG